MKEYLLKFNRLKNGKHQFNYKVTDAFFKEFEDSNIDGGELNVELSLEKTDIVLTLNFSITGNIEVPCNRCLDLVNLSVETKNVLYLKFGSETTDITDVDEIMVLNKSITEVDLSQHIFEYISLSVPARVTHTENSDTECNQEMIEQIESYMVKEETKTDPRWDVLKRIEN